ncbi:LOW QUALITY PROTEIN: meiosis-specific nuclear structural protein 1-like [Cololabis saira]|uniref:LOW QUALITY PROTEIN: meiosis-specific nuclear structural protein 1-like n=1 Tax=Cololabis saira TaxID=129043 RepID=UPI002AD43E65|nr:LOW QUALITY PROTEIN: meiosis-specific nuclear structural protein 1-like [Cololabis saira]
MRPAGHTFDTPVLKDLSFLKKWRLLGPFWSTASVLGQSGRWLQGQKQRSQLQQHREQEARRLDQERRLQASLRREESLQERRLLRQLQLEATHTDSLDDTEEKIDRQRQLEQEERMAKELARIKYEKQREEKMRQDIIKNSSELQKLESKLKTAYLNKDIAAQVAEKEATRLEAMRKEADFVRKMKSEYERVTVEQLKLKEKHEEELVQHQRALDQQLMEKERQRQEDYEEFLKEKLMVDEIIRKIYEEDQMAQQQKLEKVRATQQDIDEFRRQQAEWRRMEQEKTEEENRRIMEFARQKQHMEDTKITKMKEREEAMEYCRKMVCEKIERDRQEREEMERLREELYLEEQEEANRQREIEEMEKKIRERLMMQQTCQEQLALQEMRRGAEKEEDEAFKKMLMAKFAEDDQIEQMNDRKRRMKQLEHRREAEKLMEDKRRQREADMELEAKERAIEQEKEALRRQIIEEERQKLLQRHATKLLGYFPKGLLQEKDLEHLDEDFRKNFKTHSADLFCEEGWDEDDETCLLQFSTRGQCVVLQWVSPRGGVAFFRRPRCSRAPVPPAPVSRAERRMTESPAA